jgi:hypothetical protein
MNSGYLFKNRTVYQWLQKFIETVEYAVLSDTLVLVIDGYL